MPSLDELIVQDEQETDEDKSFNSSNTSSENSYIWTQESLAKLVGIEEGEDAKSSSQAFTDTQSVDFSTGANPNNLLTDAELFGTPPDDSTPQPQPLSSNPWSKFAFVGSGLLAVFFLAGLILSQITGSKSGKGKPKATNSTPSPTPSVVADKENTEGRLKTELALQKQADKLQKVDEATRQKNKVMKDKNKERPSQNKDKEPQPTPVRASYAPAPTPPSYQTTPPSRTWSSSPRRVPQPNVATTLPPASAPSKNPIRQIAETPPKSTASPSVDPVAQWQTLARLGSYGQVQMAEVQGHGDSVLQESHQETQEPHYGGELNHQPFESHQIEELGRGGRLRPQELPAPDTGLGTLPSPRPHVSASPSHLVETPASRASASLASNEESISEAESRILEGVPIRIATVGTATSGVLATPVIWSGNAQNVKLNRPSFSRAANADVSITGGTGGDRDFDQRFVVTLDQPLLDSEGQEVIGAGANVIFSGVGVENNGLVQATAISVVEGGKEYSLPANALSLRGADGKPLLAKGWFDRGGEIASMDTSTAFLGAIAKVGEILNLPEQETSQSISNGVSSSTTTSTTRKPNILGAVMEGGAKPLMEQIVQRNQRAIQQMEQMQNLWYVPAGESVQVFVNQSFKW